MSNNPNSGIQQVFSRFLDGFLLYDYGNESIISCNDLLLDMLGYTEKCKLIGKSRYELIAQYSSHFPNRDIHAFMAGHGDQIAQGESFRLPCVFIHANGNEMYVDLDILPYDEKNKIAFIICRDKTESVKNKKELERSHHGYRELIDNAFAAIVYFDVEKECFTDCNRQALEMTGIPSKEHFLKLAPWQFSAVDIINGVSSKERVRRLIQQALEEGKSEFVRQGRRWDGSLYWVSGTIVRDSRIVGKKQVIILMQDITEQKKAEADRDRLIQELAQQNEEMRAYIESNMALENFAAVAAHDLKAPIRSIVGFSQLLSRSLGDDLTDVEADYLQMIIDSGQHMERLVTDLLTYSKVSNSALKCAEIRVPVLLKKVKQSISRLLEESKGQIIWGALPETIKGDATRLHQLFQNLVSNSLKFKVVDRPPVIQISGYETATHWHFSVADNGMGMRSDDLERIFQLFVRLNGRSEYEGTGIGLSLCAKIVEQHEGNITVNSELGQGTTFSFSIGKQVSLCKEPGQ